MNGIEGMSASEINDELQKGGKFIVYQFCISVILITFKRNSKVFFIRGGKSAAAKSLPYTLLSLLLGWWGIPWGPIYTISTLIKNFGGGIDVTDDVIQALNQAEYAE